LTTSQPFHRGAPASRIPRTAATRSPPDSAGEPTPT
jgi:hypothetical protein